MNCFITTQKYGITLAFNRLPDVSRVIHGFWLGTANLRIGNNGNDKCRISFLTWSLITDGILDSFMGSPCRYHFYAFQ